MKIHPMVTKFKADIKRVATLNGVGDIDFEQTYTLIKKGAKVQSRMGYPDEMVALERGSFSIVGTKDILSDEVLVWIVGESLFGWFKTSPIISCKPIKTGYKIETENSYYELRKV